MASDGRRHSVDIPLSKALTTLQRVRSLRDPSTVSNSKFPTSGNWDSVSCNGSSVLDFKDSSDLRKCRSSRRRTRESDSSLSVDGDRGCKPTDTSWVSKHNDLYDDDDYNDDDDDHLLGSAEKISSAALRKRIGYDSTRDSPSMSQSEAQTNRSSNGLSIFRNEDVNAAAADDNHSGCGLSSCWSRTPRFRGGGGSIRGYSDFEDQEHPLLSSERREPATDRETSTFCLDTPRSLTQKYRPKSFDELAGQYAVAQSLTNAISKGKISPIYVFHGPRGTGKTSMARVFAAALNCLSLEANKPCGFCRECVFLFSGRSRDVKELDCSTLNKKDKIKPLLKNASRAPYSSSFKIFIIDECEFLEEQAWPAVLNCIEEIPSRRVVFIMVTSELGKLPHSAASRYQRYHFPKIKDADVVCRLQRICVEEVLEFDNEGLDCIASKSNGSLRDAETMLDQLSLIGKRITAPLVYELIGVVSDDELIDLLNLALSSDTSNTVRRARELMSSKVDPMQLVSQLANLIMDILSGRFQSGSSEAARIFFDRHTLSEVGLQKLRQALKILSETEKQLRMTKNQVTWLTAALLQFSSEESSSLPDMDDPRNFLKTGSCLRDDGLCCTVSPGESSRESSISKNSKFPNGHCDCSQKLESIWRRTIERCQKNSLKNLLTKEGKLSSIYVGQGAAIAEIQISSRAHVSKAERSWKQIASSLQYVLGCNVEIRINHFPFKNASHVKKPSFRFLCCSRRRHHLSDSETEAASTRIEGSVQTYSTDHIQSMSSPVTQLSVTQPMDGPRFSYSKEAFTIRDIDGNALSSDPSAANRHSCTIKGCSMCSEGLKNVFEDQKHSINQPCCFPMVRRKVPSSATARKIQLGMEQQLYHDILEPCIPYKASLERCLCSKKSCVFCSKSSTQTVYNSRDGDDLSTQIGNRRSNWHCWGGSKSSICKAWQHMQLGRRRRCHSVGWLPPCLSSKKSLQAIAVEEHASAA